MTSDLALRQLDSSVVQFEPIAGARRELLKRTICRDLTDDEMDLFSAICNRRRLDPFVKQIHAVKRRQWNSKLNDYEEVMVIQTGIDGFRLVAERTHQRDGVDGPWWCGEDGEWRDVWLTGAFPAAAKVVVYRKGHARGYAGIAHWEEYVQTYKDKKGNVVPVQMWAGMPAGQLAKCAEALAWRKAFPEELSGIYTDDEIAAVEESPGPVQVSGAPAGPGAATHAEARASSSSAIHTNEQGIPTGFIIPTLPQIRQVRTVTDAKQLIKGSPPGFQALVPRAIADVWGKDPHWFWDNDKDPEHWRGVVEYAVELYDQQQHETSVAGQDPPPATAQTSPSAHAAKRKGGQAEGDDPEGGEADGG